MAVVVFVVLALVVEVVIIEFIEVVATAVTVLATVAVVIVEEDDGSDGSGKSQWFSSLFVDGVWQHWMPKQPLEHDIMSCECNENIYYVLGLL